MSDDSGVGERQREEFIRIIRKAPFDAVFFETKGVNHQESRRIPFSFVLINSPKLHEFGKRGADCSTFSKHFRKAGEKHGVCFDNLGRDARLIVPLPVSKQKTCQYSHLTKFVRTAPHQQVDGVVAMVAREYLHRLHKKSPDPVWLSTSGLGVAWLHFRLDSSPKYYQYKAFAKPSSR